MLHRAPDLEEFFLDKRLNLMKIDARFGAWNIRSLKNGSGRDRVGRDGLDSSVRETDRWNALVNTVMNLRVP
jgi:hypothetical protein